MSWQKKFFNEKWKIFGLYIRNFSCFLFSNIEINNNRVVEKEKNLKTLRSWMEAEKELASTSTSKNYSVSAFSFLKLVKKGKTSSFRLLRSPGRWSCILFFWYMLNCNFFLSPCLSFRWLRIEGKFTEKSCWSRILDVKNYNP